MRFVFHNPSSPAWDYRNPGIGQQTHHSQMCWRLAQRGHVAISFSKLPPNLTSGWTWMGAEWFDVADTNFGLEGIWIIYGDAQHDPLNNQVIWPYEQIHSIDSADIKSRLDSLINRKRRIAISWSSEFRAAALSIAEIIHKLAKVYPPIEVRLIHEGSGVPLLIDSLASLHLCRSTDDEFVRLLEAQACGSIPAYASDLICNTPSASVLQMPLVPYGRGLTGNPNDLEVQAAFAAELIGLAMKPEAHDAARNQISEVANRDFDWGRTVSSWLAKAFLYFDGTITDDFCGYKYTVIPHFIFDHQGEKESREKWLKLCPGDVFLDIGSSIGSWTLPAAALGARVYAFDPGTDLACLERLVALNKFEDRVTTVPKMVSDRSGRTVKRSQIPWFSVQAERSFGDAETISIDDFVAQNKLTRIDFIKVDTDGGEREVLKGMRNTLAIFRPRIVVETHDFLGVSYNEIAGILALAGYEVEAVEKEEGYYHHVFGKRREAK